MRHFRNIALTVAFLVGIAALSGYGAPSHSEVDAFNAHSCADAPEYNVCPTSSPAAPVWQTLPDCPTEDSDNCYWDAAMRGNGQGVSFYVIAGTIHFLSN